MRVPGPGLTKARSSAQAVAARGLRLVALRHGWWASVLARADIVSEGGELREPSGVVYYGTTSLHCPVDDSLLRLAPAPVDSAAALLRLILNDPHARLRMTRLAHREAVGRAGGPLGVLHLELSGAVRRSRGRTWIAVSVDVSGEVASMPSTGSRG